MENYLEWKSKERRELELLSVSLLFYLWEQTTKEETDFYDKAPGERRVGGKKVFYKGRVVVRGEGERD